MAMESFTLMFEVPSGKGLPAEGIADALQGVQDAVRHLVEHLGDRQPQSGRPPGWVTLQSALQVAGARSGSLVFDLELAPTPTQQPYLDNHGPAAIDALLNWDGEEGSTLPMRVTDRLYEVRGKFPEDMKLWLGSTSNRHGVELKARQASPDATSDETEALLYGWLREINWYRRTAQLHDHQGGFVSLRFDADLHEVMLRLATRFVEIRGHGRINAKDEWTTVQVGQINPAGSLNEPFDKEAFLNDPSPRIFDPGQVVRASEPFDVDEFMRYIHETREDSPE
jgi:hypothetical protein